MTDRPRVKLMDEDGNAFRIIGVCARAAKKANWSEDKWTSIKKDMMSGDYDHLLQVATIHFDVY